MKRTGIAAKPSVRFLANAVAFEAAAARPG